MFNFVNKLDLFRMRLATPSLASLLFAHNCGAAVLVCILLVNGLRLPQSGDAIYLKEGGWMNFSIDSSEKEVSVFL